MSEFTSGTILLAKDREVVRKHAVKGSVIMQLNDKFIAYLTEDNYIGELVPESIIQLSQEIPLLYFYNFEDHHWGYRLLVQGEEVGDLHIAYEYEEEIAYSIAKKKYPDMGFNELYFGGLLEEIREELEAGSVFKESFEAIFNNCRLELFSLLAVSDEQISRLKGILNTDYINHDISEGMELADEFKTILGIEEMSFIRHERVVESGEYDELF